MQTRQHRSSSTLKKKNIRRTNARARQEQNAAGRDGSNSARHPEHVTVATDATATPTTTTNKLPNSNHTPINKIEDGGKDAETLKSYGPPH